MAYCNTFDANRLSYVATSRSLLASTLTDQSDFGAGPTNTRLRATLAGDGLAPNSDLGDSSSCWGDISLDPTRVEPADTRLPSTRVVPGDNRFEAEGDDGDLGELKSPDMSSSLTTASSSLSGECSDCSMSSSD